jgi:hypothetical protein
MLSAAAFRSGMFKRSNRSIRSSCSTSPFSSDGLNDLNGLNYLNRTFVAIRNFPADPIRS